MRRDAGTDLAGHTHRIKFRLPDEAVLCPHCGEPMIYVRTFWYMVTRKSPSG